MMQNTATRKDTAYLRTLWELTSSIQQAPDLMRALESAFLVVQRAIGAQNGSIWFAPDPDAQEIKASFAAGPSAEKVLALRLGMGEGIPGSVISTGKTHLVTDCQNDPRWRQKHDQTTGYFIKTLLCVPIITQDGCVGCIELTNKLDGMLFTARDAHLCEDYASFMAIAMDESGFFLRPAPASDEILYVSGLSLDGVNEVNFDVKANEILVCLASEARQRDVLFQSLGGLEKPERGYIVLATNADVFESAQSATDYRRNTVGIIDAKSPLLSDLSVRANVSLAASLAELPMSVEQALSLADCTDIQQLMPSELTPMQHLCAQIARAMVKNPSMILLREPAEQLGRAHLLRILAMLEIIAQNHCSVVLLTCDRRFIPFGQRAIRLRDGAIDRMQVNLRRANDDTLFN